MKRTVFAEISPFDKDAVLLALEAGVDGIVTEDAHIEEIKGLARVQFLGMSGVKCFALDKKEDELAYENAVRQNPAVLHTLTKFEIIPVENLLAKPDIAQNICLTVNSYAEAKLAFGILERGVEKIIVSGQGLADIRKIMELAQTGGETMQLEAAVITKLQTVGLGHRVCVDTLSVLETGQGMLCGNSSAFTFLVHAETEDNEYVNSRPFRVNAGGVHAYAMMPNDKTSYLQELRSGSEVLVVDKNGHCKSAVVGRVKIEVRPMLMVEAKTKDGKTGGIFLQNAETIRLVGKNGKPVSVVSLKEGDEVLCHLDCAGRHFGMRVEENITE